MVQIESEGKGSSFSKATFSSTLSRNDIDIDDPNFWDKWAKKADVDLDEMANRDNLIIEMPRKRTKTTRFGGENEHLDISELESSDSETESDSGLGRGRGRDKKGRKRRGRGDEDLDAFPIEGYTRSEYFRVEKTLLVYGWGRWADILDHGRFKRHLEESDVEAIARATLLYALKCYNGA